MKSLQSITSFNSKRAGFTPAAEFQLRKKKSGAPTAGFYHYKKSFADKYLTDEDK